MNTILLIVITKQVASRGYVYLVIFFMKIHVNYTLLDFINCFRLSDKINVFLNGVIISFVFGGDLNDWRSDKQMVVPSRGGLLVFHTMSQGYIHSNVKIFS